MGFDHILLVSQDEEEEEDLVDPHETLREDCREKGDAPKLRAKFEECEERVNSRSKTEETCVEELLDYLHAVDHCVSAAHTFYAYNYRVSRKFVDTYLRLKSSANFVKLWPEN